MSTTRALDDLIEAGWHVLDTDFDPAAFHHWRRQASFCLEALLGRGNPYPQSFTNSEPEEKDLLADRAILTPTMEQLE
jgi:hypothetical protein